MTDLIADKLEIVLHHSLPSPSAFASSPATSSRNSSTVMSTSALTVSWRMSNLRLPNRSLRSALRSVAVFIELVWPNRFAKRRFSANSAAIDSGEIPANSAA
jgi:hypothetical protein